MLPKWRLWQLALVSCYNKAKPEASPFQTANLRIPLLAYKANRFYCAFANCAPPKSRFLA